MAIAQLNRAVWAFEGENCTAWLESLICNSLNAPMSFAALLTPQGKIIADFFITQDADRLWLDVPVKFASPLMNRLKLYKLRAPINILNMTATYKVYAVWNQSAPEHMLLYAPDPRLPALGGRLISPQKYPTDADYNTHRLTLGVPDSAYDFETESYFPSDVNMDLLRGVDYHKGCFIGQEVVSRMKRRASQGPKKRFHGLLFSNIAHVGDKILAGERIVGEVVHVHDTGTERRGMGLIHKARLQNNTQPLMVNAHRVTLMEIEYGKAG